MIIDFIVMIAIFRAELLELVAQLQCECGTLRKSSRSYVTERHFMTLEPKIVLKHILYIAT